MPRPFPPRSTWDALLETALAEDLGAGDVTSEICVPADARGEAGIETRQPVQVAGLPLAAAVFGRCGVEFEPLAEEGSALAVGSTLAHVRGPARGILAGERLALNFLSRLSAVATHTARFCAAVAGTPASIVDTRKTTPGWRALEKYAVGCGGGLSHRMGLFDGIMLKDNHVAAAGSVGEAVRRARAQGPLHLRLFVEVESVADAEAALEAGADVLMIDNQPPPVIEKIVERVDGRVPLEATGGVTLETVASIARTGVARISIGGLTHNPPPVDLGLEWIATSSR